MREVEADIEEENVLHGVDGEQKEHKRVASATRRHTGKQVGEDIDDLLLR